MLTPIDPTIPMEEITSKVIHQFFESGGGSENAHLLVRHQIESYNEFLDKNYNKSSMDLIQLLCATTTIQLFMNLHKTFYFGFQSSYQ